MQFINEVINIARSVMELAEDVQLIEDYSTDVNDLLVEYGAIVEDDMFGDFMSGEGILVQLAKQMDEENLKRFAVDLLNIVAKNAQPQKERSQET
jgi:hypothetical protein